MKYKIGEVSDITGISKEMIRYYEKKGALNPDRETGNNYRTYSTMDVFFLMEISRYQAMNFSMKEISSLLGDSYMKKYTSLLKKHQEEIRREVLYSTLLSRRLSDMADRAEACMYNLNRCWIRKVPAMEGVLLCAGKNDDYGDFLLEKQEQELLFAQKNMPFFESTVFFREDEEEWYYCIEHKLAQQLGYSQITGRHVFPEQLCLCTTVDMGEVGQFDRSVLDHVIRTADEDGYEITGPPFGFIVGRGYEKNIFTRLLEIYIPIKP